MNTLIETLNGLANFETHQIDGIGQINIRKPGLADIDQVQALELSDDDESTSEVKKVARLVAMNFIVDDQGNPIFNEDNIVSFMNLPMDYLLDIISAFRETFDKINVKAEDLKKKH